MISSVPPICFIFCGPSGSGKSTLCQRLVMEDPQLYLSVSTTSRKARGNEENGKQYHFVTEEEFQERIHNGAFLEHAIFAGQCYGTEWSNLKEAERQGADLVFDIDVQGAVTLKEKLPQQVVLIFVFPPSFEILVQRVKNRGTENSEQLTKRLNIAREEIARLKNPNFSDYLLINDQLEQAINQARAIIQAERIRLSRANPVLLEKIFG